MNSDLPKSRRWADQAGIWLSFLCLIHCFGSVAVLLFLPAVATYFTSEGVHRALMLILPLIALAAFWPGFKRHGDTRVVIAGGAGLVFITVGALLSRSLPLVGEAAVTTAGSLLLIHAHWRNRQLCQTCGEV